jgi:apolipoprotein N-acyltransferase
LLFYKQQSEKIAWLWLILGGLLLPFTHIQTVFPIAPWIAPVFIIRFLRSQRAVIGIPAVFVVYSAAAAVSLRNGFFDPPPDALFMTAISGGYGLILSLAYFIDRLIAPRLTGLPRPLVFPLALTSIDWLMTFSPFYTYGSFAYTQHGVLPIMHLDHMYFDRELALEEFVLHRSRMALVASDHLPLVAEFGLGGR